MKAHTTDCQTNVMQYLISEPMTDYGVGREYCDKQTSCHTQVETAIYITALHIY